MCGPQDLGWAVRLQPLVGLSDEDILQEGQEGGHAWRNKVSWHSTGRWYMRIKEALFYIPLDNKELEQLESDLKPSHA